MDGQATFKEGLTKKMKWYDWLSYFNVTDESQILSAKNICAQSKLIKLVFVLGVLRQGKVLLRPRNGRSFHEMDVGIQIRWKERRTASKHVETGWRAIISRYCQK